MIVPRPADRAGDQPQHRRLAALDPLQPAPHQRAGAGGEMRGDDREHRARPRRERRAAVEAEPADPQQPRADDRQRQIERREILAAETLALADHQRRDQPGDAGVDVHDGSAGEIQQTHLLQEAAAPHPMRRGNIDDEQPHRAKQHEGRELHALGDRAADQRASNDREGHLIGHEQYFGDSLGERTDRLDADPASSATRAKSPR